MAAPGGITHRLKLEVTERVKAEVRRRGFVRVGEEASRFEGLRAGTKDLDDFAHSVIATVRPYTLTSDERVAALTASIEYLVRAGVPGAIVECGVWRGGSLMAAGLALKRLGVLDRDLYGFDTFTGMTEPTEVDIDYEGNPAGPIEPVDDPDLQRMNMRAVTAAVDRSGYPTERLTLVPGRVEDTLPAQAPEAIALLRLDTDWYESTRHELEHLYPRLAKGGILIVDDYGQFQGARKAVTEYFASQPVFISRIDYTGRLVVKP